MRRYERVEMRVAQDVTRVVVTQEGESAVVLPFDWQETVFEYDAEGYEHVSAAGAVEKRVRFTPWKAGECAVAVYAGEAVTEKRVYAVEESDARGFVEVSNADPRYLAWSDGTGYAPIGMNMTFPTEYAQSSGAEFGVTGERLYLGLKQYESWMKKAAKNGVDFVRIWVGHEYFTPDTGTAYVYDLTQFGKIDRLVEMAGEYGIVLKFTLEQFRYFQYGKIEGYRNFAKQMTLDGERCEDVQAWLREEKWRAAWLHKVREFAKRYAGDVRVCMIELWNEMNCMGRAQLNSWNEAMLPAVKAMFPRQLVVNSLGSMDCADEIENYRNFCWEKSDVMQMHRYLDQGAKMAAVRENPVELMREGVALMRPGDKPFFVAETGAVNDCHSGPFRYYGSDDEGLLLGDCVIPPLLLGASGCGHIWHWDARYVESKNLYHLYAPIAQLQKGIEFDKEGFVPVDASTEEAYVLLLKGREHTLGYVRSKKSDWKAVLRDGKEPEIVPEVRIALEGAEGVRGIAVWADDAEVLGCGGEIVVKGLRYGVLFRIGS